MNVYMSTLRNMGILLLAACFLASCSSAEEIKAKRAAHAAKNQGPISIAIVWPVDDTLPFLNGVNLAVDEINNAGGVLGRKLQTVIYNEPENRSKVTEVSRRIAKDLDILAVIGHSDSASAIPASITYDANGIIFIAPASSSPSLTAHGFEYIFRTVASDATVGRRLAQFTHDLGYRKIVILDDNSIYGQGLADIYLATAVDLGIEIITHKAYFPWQSEYKNLISEFSNLDFDAVLLAGLMPNAANMIKQCREMGIQVPFISGDGLDIPELIHIAGEAAEGTVVPTVFNPNADNRIVREFISSYEKRFHTPPETWDALGYDAVKLLAFAFTKSGTTIPIVVSSTLRFNKGWQGVTGEFAFAENGELKGKPLYFKEVRNGRFEFIKE